MIEDLRDLLEDLVKDKQFIKDMKYKLRHAKRDSEARGEILGEYLYELESEIVEQLVKEGMFTINDNLVMTYEYNEHSDEYTFYNQNYEIISTITGKISNHDELEEEDPEGDKLYLELGKIFGDPIKEAN